MLLPTLAAPGTVMVLVPMRLNHATNRGCKLQQKECFPIYLDDFRDHCNVVDDQGQPPKVTDNTA